MKKVFSNSSSVIHLFVQRSQTEANCKNVFFESNRLYSYGRHYLLAEFIKNSAGEEASMINDEGYSVTTSGHITEIRQASRQYKQFFTMQTDPAKVCYRLTNLAHKLQSARKPELYIQPAEYLFSKFEEFQAWNGETNDKTNLLKIRELITVFRGASYSEYLNKQAEIIKQAEKRALMQAKKQFKKDLKEFFAYKRAYLYNNPTNEDYLRISEDGQSIETSQRVIVPIREAKILYQMIVNGKDIKGYNIAGYTVIGLNGILKIGCHKINLKNMHEIGTKIMSM